MSASAQATPPNDPGPQPADTQDCRQVLQYVINVDADLVRLLHEQAIAQAAQHAPAPAPHAAAPAPQPTGAQPAPVPGATPDALIKTAAAYDQVARAIRRSIALVQSLDAPKQPARHPAQHSAPDRTATRKRIIRALEDNIQRPPDNPELDDAEVLLAEFRERMDAPDLDNDISSRPVEDIIKEICRDLGLAALPGTRPWKRRTPADIADLCARAAAPSSPTWSADHQPSPEQQNGHPVAAQHSSDPADRPKQGHPAAPARPPVLPGQTLPEDPAEAVAFILHHAARTNTRWRPLPDD